MSKSNEEWSSQDLKAEKTAKFRTSTGFEPVTSRYRCDAASYAIAYIAYVTARIILHLISFPRYIYHLHLFYGNIWTHNWPAPNISGFIAHLIKASHRYREGTGSNPLKSWNFFSAFLRNCVDCVHNCEDHSSFDFFPAVLMWFISYTPIALNE